MGLLVAFMRNSVLWVVTMTIVPDLPFENVPVQTATDPLVLQGCAQCFCFNARTLRMKTRTNSSRYVHPWFAKATNNSVMMSAMQINHLTETFHRDVNLSRFHHIIVWLFLLFESPVASVHLVQTASVVRHRSIYSTMFILIEEFITTSATILIIVIILVINRYRPSTINRETPFISPHFIVVGCQKCS